MIDYLKRNKYKIAPIAIIVYYLIIYVFCTKWKVETIKNIGILSIGIIVIIAVKTVVEEYGKTKKINYDKIITSIIILGLIIRTMYILYTPITERQHDMEKEIGHLAYIETIYETGKLPTHNKWQFYHQPLHHIIGASWLKINEKFRVDLEKSEEGIQILTAIYSSIIMIIVCKILSILKIKGKYKVLVMLVIALHPTLIILSGSINNDILMTMLTFLIVLYLLKWNEEPSIKNTILLAIFTALCALTKITGTIVAIPIMYTFIKKLYEEFKVNKDKEKVLIKFIIRFIIFGIIALGIGLSYSIRNYKLFNQYIFYVPKPSYNIYCGDRSLSERFSLISNEFFETYCCALEDCNIFAYIIKSSLFGEFYNYPRNLINEIIAIILKWINLIICLIVLISFIRILTRYRKWKNNKTGIMIMILLFITQLVMYIYANIKNPYGCTMDFRYLVPTIFTGAFFIITNFSDMEEKRLYLKSMKLIYVIFGLFAILSIFMFVII